MVYTRGQFLSSVGFFRCYVLVIWKHQHNIHTPFLLKLRCINNTVGDTVILTIQHQPPSHSSLFTPYSIFAYMLVILCASCKLIETTSDLSTHSPVQADPKFTHFTTSPLVTRFPCGLSISSQARLIISTINSTASLHVDAPVRSSAGSA
jgi:hypothetical protein